MEHKYRNTPVTLRQGDTTTITMELSQPIDGLDIKAGIYTPTGKELFCAYLSDGGITAVDETHLLLELTNIVTRRFVGATTLRLVVFRDDRSLVNAGENCIILNWQEEPATRSLKGGCQ